MSDPVQYRQLGIRGDRPSTKRGTICSIISKNLVFKNLTKRKLFVKNHFSQNLETI